MTDEPRLEEVIARADRYLSVIGSDESDHADKLTATENLERLLIGNVVILLTAARRAEKAERELQVCRWGALAMLVVCEKKDKALAQIKGSNCGACLDERNGKTVRDDEHSYICSIARKALVEVPDPATAEKSERFIMLAETILRDEGHNENTPHHLGRHICAGCLWIRDAIEAWAPERKAAPTLHPMRSREVL